MAMLLLVLAKAAIAVLHKATRNYCSFFDEERCTTFLTIMNVTECNWMNVMGLIVSRRTGSLSVGLGRQMILYCG